MNTLIENEKQIILDYFEASSNDYWKTLREISAATNVRLEDVIEIVFTTKDFVESYYRHKNGEPVFTPRKVYEKRTSFWLKLLAAFCDRII
ncbi:hypothetical protein [Chitinophaga filiformis]|uniref:Uncharacterized protein n=1 Tax=Chitinophaga filiformis TaxID=104663 RepID=A0ABY4I3S2_CHIFI|nr:hypothetical protein [Chitinophaga filiformis]UPK69391.1 hypothetical protein MYF79_30990 [Chitinophaga filiformis]